MRIAVINLSVRTISGGYEEYLRQFFFMAGKDNDIEEILFVSVAPILDRFNGLPKVKKLELTRVNALLGSAIGVSKAIRMFNPDVLYIPMEKRFKGIRGFPVVTMLQNMEPFVPAIKGNSLAWRFILRIMRMRAVSAIKHSDHIIALSEFVKETLVGSLGIDPEKITKIPHGDHDFSDLKPEMPKLLHSNVEFIFTAGSLSPARGLEDLVSAFISLKSQGELKNIKLCIAGELHKYNHGWFNRLLHNIKTAGLESEVLWLGFLSKAEMMWCFRNTRLFIMTSRVESFGITAIEAMANNTNVISTNSPCLPETFGDYPIFYNAYDSSDLAKKISAFLNGNNTCVPGKMIRRFSWKDNYQLTKNLFMRLVSE